MMSVSVSSYAEVLGDQRLLGKVMGIFFIFLKEIRVEMRIYRKGK